MAASRGRRCRCRRSRRFCGSPHATRHLCAHDQAERRPQRRRNHPRREQRPPAHLAGGRPNLAPTNLRQFWINPGNGALLLQTYTSGLWTSTDGGATWEQMAIPSSSAGQYMVRQSPTDQAWHLCAEYYGSQNASTGSLLCTVDGGKPGISRQRRRSGRWRALPAMGRCWSTTRVIWSIACLLGATRWQKLGARHMRAAAFSMCQPALVVCCGCSRRRAMARARRQTHGQSLAPGILIDIDAGPDERIQATRSISQQPRG